MEKDKIYLYETIDELKQDIVAKNISMDIFLYSIFGVIQNIITAIGAMLIIGIAAYIFMNFKQFTDFDTVITKVCILLIILLIWAVGRAIVLKYTTILFVNTKFETVNSMVLHCKEMCDIADNEETKWQVKPILNSLYELIDKPPFCK